MLYSCFSDYMLRGWGRFDPPVKVGGCGGAFWTTPTLPSLDACTACVAAKKVHFPREEGRSRAGEYLGRVHIDIHRANVGEMGWWKGIRVHRRGRLYSCGGDETTTAQAGSARSLQGIPGRSREQIPENDT